MRKFSGNCERNIFVMYVTYFLNHFTPNQDDTATMPQGVTGSERQRKDINEQNQGERTMKERVSKRRMMAIGVAFKFLKIISGREGRNRKGLSHANKETIRI